MKALLLFPILLLASCMTTTVTDPDGTITETRRPDPEATATITSGTVEAIDRLAPSHDK